MHRVNFEKRVVVKDIAAGTVGHIAVAGEVLHIVGAVMVLHKAAAAGDVLHIVAAEEVHRIVATLVFHMAGAEAEAVGYKPAVLVEAGHRATADKEIDEDPGFDLGRVNLEMVVPVTWPIQVVVVEIVAAGMTSDRAAEANRRVAAAQGIVGYTVDSCLLVC